MLNTRSALQRSRTGFTLVEILVLIVVIAILIALIIPAIQQVRISAADTQCKNNLKQMGIAALQYESTYKAFPPGYIGPLNNETNYVSVKLGDPENNQWVGHLSMLLPFLDNETLYRQASLTENLRLQSPPWWEPEPTPADPLPPNYQVAIHPLNVFQCPLDNQPPPSNMIHNAVGTVAGNHFYNKGPFLRENRVVENHQDDNNKPYPWRLAHTNYVGSGGSGRGTSTWWQGWEGIYTNRSVTTISKITDGTSNTILYGEVAGRSDIDPAGLMIRNSVNISWFGVGAIPSNWGLERGGRAAWFQYSSFHPAGPNFCMADGTVKIMPYLTTPYAMMKACGFRDNAYFAE